MIRKLRRQLARVIWPHIAPKHTDTKAVVVTGFPRSGTSLLCGLLASSGILFRLSQNERPADQDNPGGYFEYRPFIRLSRRFFFEARLSKAFVPRETDTLRAKGFFGRLRRPLTRRAMARLVDAFVLRGQPWGVKFFPSVFTIWSAYVPDAPVVAIYRDPLATADSYLRKWPEALTIEQILDEWVRQHRIMLSQLAGRRSLVIRYEDILDPATRPAVMTALAEFLKLDQVPDTSAIMDRGRGIEAVERLHASYPVPDAVTELQNALNDQAFSPTSA